MVAQYPVKIIYPDESFELAYALINESDALIVKSTKLDVFKTFVMSYVNHNKKYIEAECLVLRKFGENWRVSIELFLT
jgi:hypothetical protein